MSYEQHRITSRIQCALNRFMCNCKNMISIYKLILITQTVLGTHLDKNLYNQTQLLVFTLDRCDLEI